MDPNETFRTYVNAMCDDDIDTALQALKALREWYNNSGFSAKFCCSPEDKGCPVPLAFITHTIDALSVYVETCGNGVA